MKSLNVIRQFLKFKPQSAGFTLPELLISAGLMSVVIMAGGAGVVNLMTNQINVTAEIEGRLEIDQALNLIGDEIRQAISIEQYIDSTQLARVSPNFTLPTGVNGKPVLLLNLPQAQEKIIYFVADKPADAPWSGPQLIYRWGPAIDTNGQYSNLNDPTQWKINPLVDQIDNAPLEDSWTCANGTLTPSTGATGFYACVQDGKIAQLYLNGKIHQSKGETALYQAVTEVFARARETNLDASTSTLTSAPVSAPAPPPSSTTPSVGTAHEFAILGLDGGNVIINSSTSLIGDVGYSRNVTSLSNQKVSTFNSAVYVHGTADFAYTDKNFIPSQGIVFGDSADAKVEQASSDAIAASATFAEMTPTETIGALGDGDDYTIESQGDVNVISLASVDYNYDTLTLKSRTGHNDVFIINVIGNFKFNGSTIELLGVTADRVIFNFPNASDIMLNKDANVFNGTILAPKGNVEYHNPATFNGAIYAKNINLNSMFNLNKASFNP